MTAGTVVAAAAAAIVAGRAAPYLAGLTITVPERSTSRWWRVARVSRARTRTTVLVGVGCGALAGAAAGWTAALPAFVWLAILVTPLTVIDVEHHRLPDRLVAPAGIGAIILLAFAVLLGHDLRPLERAAEAALVVFVGFFAVGLGAPFGFGDTKLGAVLGGYLGWLGWAPVLYGIFAAFVVASLSSLTLLAMGRIGLKSTIPFGPALVAGTLLVAASGSGAG